MKTIIFTSCCGICETEKVEGIHIYQMFICTECEQEIVHTEPEAVIYREYIQKLKGMTQMKLYS